MGLLSLAWRNVIGNLFRSLAVFACAALVAVLALLATFVVRGAESSLRANLERLGADILALPWGTMTEKIGGIRLMSAAVDGWMPQATVGEIAALEGVAAVSPQLYLATLEDSPYSPYPEMSLVAFDPATDFTLSPWLEEGVLTHLGVGDAIAGAHIALPEGGDETTLYGVPLRIVDRLEPTKTTIDNTLFVSFATADEMVASSIASGLPGPKIMPGSVSAVMVRLELGYDPHEVAVRMLEQVRGVVPLETPGFFQTERQQMIGVLRTLLALLAAIWMLAVAFMGLVFSIAVNERRAEIGVLRALGFRSTKILQTLLIEGAMVALSGGLAGVILAAIGMHNFADDFVRVVGVALYEPSPAGLVVLSLAGQALALASVTLAAFVPAWRISHEEVALTMRA